MRHALARHVAPNRRPPRHHRNLEGIFSVKRRSMLAITVSVLLLAGPAASQVLRTHPGAFDERFVTRHAQTVGKQKLRYTATVMSTVIKDAEGRPAARFVTTDYVRDGVKNPSRRPVLFAWSGGPSAPAHFEQMRILGPKRLLDPAPGREAAGPTIIDNPDWPLDVIDIVVVDPAETGFSRVLPDGRRDYFYSVAGDTASIEQFMQTWLKARGREASPLYLWGGSYGSVRAIRVAWDLRNSSHPVDGLFLPANCAMLQETGGVVGVALALPTQEIRAVYRGTVARGGRTDAQILDASYAFAINEYLPALAAVQDLTPDAKATMAAKLAARSGVSEERYLAHDLAPGPELDEPARGDGSPAVPSASLTAFTAFLRTELGVTYPGDSYRSRAPETSGWDYAGPSEAKTPSGGADWPRMLRETMEANARMRVYSANGYDDELCTVGQARFMFSRTKLPRDRVTVREYPGPHGLYRNPATASLMAEDLRAMVFAGFR